MGKNALGLAVGASNVDRLEPLMAPAEPSADVLSMRFDMQAAAALMVEQSNQAFEASAALTEQQGDDPAERDQALAQIELDRETVVELYRQMSEVFRQIGIRLRLTAEGFELSYDIELADS